MRKLWLFPLLLSLSLATTALIVACNKIPEVDLEKATACSSLGRALGDKRELDKAIAKALDLDSYLAVVRQIQGGIQHDQKKLDQAIAAYREAIRLDPNDVSAYNSLGIVLYDQGKIDEAISVWHQVIQLDPDNIFAHNNLGLALIDQNKLDKAIDLYRKTIELAPNCAFVYSNLGNALVKQNKLDDATIAYRRAIQLDPNIAGAYVNLGWVLHIQKKPDKAIEAYRQALRLPEDKSIRPASAHTMAHNNLGYTLQQQGKLEEAIEEYKWAKMLDPKYVTPQNNLKEAQRLLKLKQDPATSEQLPSLDEQPLLYLLRSVVLIITDDPTGVEYGAGWVVKRENKTVWIVTNRHVISDKVTHTPSKKIEVEFYSESSSGQVPPRYTARIAKLTNSDDPLDLAVLEVTGIPDDIKPLPMSSSRVGRTTPVQVIGHPSNGGCWTPVSGEISNIIKSSNKPPQLQIDANLAEGNSGGPVIDKEKQVVVGMMVQIADGNQSRKDAASNAAQAPTTGGFGFAYPMEIIMEKLRSWGIL